MSSSNRMDRRSFAAQLALGAGGLTAAGLTPLGQAIAVDDNPVPNKANAADPPAEKESDEAKPASELPSAEVLLLAHLTRLHPSEHFDEEALAGILRDVRGDVARGRLLSKFSLKNADEPAFTFAASRTPTASEQ